MSKAAAPVDGDRRERIMQAAARCFRQFGVTKTTVDDIARQAGVSRATMYRTVPGGRDEIVLEVLLAEARLGYERIRVMMDPLPDFESRLVEGIAAAVEGIRDDPNLAMLFTAETVTSAVAIPGAWTALQRATSELIAPFTLAARAAREVREDLSDDEVAEWINRAIVSVVAFPGHFSEEPDSLRDYVRRFFVPSLVVRQA